jgi:hypothetical protein
MERDRRRAARKAEKKRRLAEMRAAQAAGQQPEARPTLTRSSERSTPPEAPSTNAI